MYGFYGPSAVSIQRGIEYIADKDKSFSSYVNQLYERINIMFNYKNMPEGIDVPFLEFTLQDNGSAFITKVDDRIYVFYGSPGGEPDVYYRPTLYIVANPGLRLDKTFRIFNLDGSDASDGIFAKNTTTWEPVRGIVYRYAAFLTETDISMLMASYTTRIPFMITAPDDTSRNAANKFLTDIIKGNIGSVADNRFLDGIAMLPSGTNGRVEYLKTISEHREYLIGSFYRELGLDYSINQRAERMTSKEVNINTDALLPLIDNMLMCRREFIKKMNDLYGTEASVEFNSSWLENKLERDIILTTGINPATPGAETGNTNLDGDIESQNVNVNSTDLSTRPADTTGTETTTVSDDNSYTYPNESKKETEKEPIQSTEKLIDEIEEIIEETILDVVKGPGNDSLEDSEKTDSNEEENESNSNEEYVDPPGVSDSEEENEPDSDHEE